MNPYLLNYSSFNDPDYLYDCGDGPVGYRRMETMLGDYSDSIGEIKTLEEATMCLELFQKNFHILERCIDNDNREIAISIKDVYKAIKEVEDAYKEKLESLSAKISEREQENKSLKVSLENTQEKVRFLEKKLNKLIIAKMQD